MNFHLKISITIFRNSSETLNYWINWPGRYGESTVREEMHQKVKASDGTVEVVKFIKV